MYIAKKNFSGVITAHKGQTIDIKNKSVATDLLNADYIEEYSKKNQNVNELSKTNKSLVKQVEELTKTKEELTNENNALKEQLSNINSVDDSDKKTNVIEDPNNDNKDPEITKEVNKDLEPNSSNSAE